MICPNFHSYFLVSSYLESLKDIVSGSLLFLSLTFQELLNELQKFLETEKDELILEVMNPPPKKIRLQELEDSIDNLSQNGEGRVSLSQDGSIASKNSNLNVCNVCLGILQEFCEKDFVKKVNNLFFIIGAIM